MLRAMSAFIRSHERGARVSETPDPRIGTELAGYRIESLIGRGGMGTVYRAEDLTLGRKVALKLISPELSEDEVFRERFRAEWRLAASIDHPNVIPIHEAGEHDETLFIAMRYVDGTDLKQLINDDGPLEPERAIALLSQTAEGLDAAHSRGLVHRDVKPSNVLIARDGSTEHVYLADFGLTKPASDEVGAKESIALSGSYDYVSPEQITDGTAAPASDIYSLGALLYESLTGLVPFPHERTMQTLFAHMNDEPPAPSEVDPELPPALDEVVATAMAKEAADRYESGAALAQAATAALPSPKRSRWQLAALLGILALLLAAAIAIPAILLTGGGDEAARAGNPSPTTPAVQRIDTETGALAATVELQRTADGIAATDEDVYVFDKSGQALLPVDPDTNATGEPIPLDAVAADGRVQRVTGRADSLFVAGGGPCESGDLCPVKSFVPETGSFAEVNGIKSEGSTANEPPVDAFGDVWFLDSFGTFAHSTLVRFSDGGISPTATIRLGNEEFPESGGAVFGVDERSLWVLAASATLVDATSRSALGEAMALWRVDPGTNEIVDVVELPLVHKSVEAFAVGAGSLWIPDGADDAVLRIDQSTSAVQNTIRVGRQPIAAVFANGAVWVANGRDGTVSRIDPDTLDVSTTTVGGTPTGIVAAGDSVWVAMRP
jgi:hypothetical protein